jgi:hypothetical protein
MRNSPLVLFPLFLVVVWSAVIEIKSPLKSGHTRRAGVTALANAPIVESYGRLPLSFEANQGQTDSQVNFFSRGSGYSLFMTSSEAVLSLKPGRDRQGAGNFRAGRRKDRGSNEA